MQAPEICGLYTLSVSPQYVRQQIRYRFEENRHVSDLRVINHLLLKGRQEYQETMNFWKMRDHVMGKLLAPRGRPQRSFLEKFYEGALYTLRSRLSADICTQVEMRTRFSQQRLVPSFPHLRYQEYISCMLPVTKA